MSAQGVANGEHHIAQQAGTPVHPKASVDARRLLVAESLQVGNPGNNARDLPVGPDARGARDQSEHQIELTVDDIRPYENNPRRSLNVKFDDIKESIRTSGLRSPLTVTRRPGESHFIIEAGGNTRLLALRQTRAQHYAQVRGIQTRGRLVYGRQQIGKLHRFKLGQRQYSGWVNCRTHPRVR